MGKSRGFIRPPGSLFIATFLEIRSHLSGEREFINYLEDGCKSNTVDALEWINRVQLPGCVQFGVEMEITSELVVAEGALTTRSCSP